jgi:hypothetical protein
MEVFGLLIIFGIGVLDWELIRILDRLNSIHAIIEETAIDRAKVSSGDRAMTPEENRRFKEILKARN